MENQPLLWDIIKPERLNDWLNDNKQKIYIEHDCTLRVNRRSSVLKLPDYGLLPGASFKVTNNQELCDALEQAEASIRNDIKTIMCFRKHHSFAIQKLEMNVAAISNNDGVYWQLGLVEISVDDYPTLEDVARYVLTDIDTGNTELFGGFHEVGWKKVLNAGISDCIKFTENRKDGERYCWELFQDELSLTIHTSPRYIEDSYLLCFGFQIKNFSDAVEIRKKISESKWDELLCSGVVEKFGERFRVYSYATKTYDIVLSLSSRPKDRGFWGDPVNSSGKDFGDEKGFDLFMMKPKGKLKRLKASTLREAINEIKESTRPIFPNFNIFRWETISLLIHKGDKWSLDAHHTKLTFFNGVLTVSFRKNRSYSEPVHLPATVEFDTAFEAAWRSQIEDGRLASTFNCV